MMLGAMTASGTAPLRVLFIGNSLTTANGLADMVEELASMAGDPAIAATVVAAGGYSLEDHWNLGEARRTLGSGPWNAVVLQQGPSSQPESRTLLRDYVARFHDEAKARGVRVALYMVWPPRAGPGTFEQVEQSYRLAAKDVGALLLPAGAALRAALSHPPREPLLGPDGFHPAPLGTLLAAVVIHQHLTGRDTPFVPQRVAARGSAPAIPLDAATRDLLQSAAIAAAQAAR
jgi:hypothetical protein